MHSLTKIQTTQKNTKGHLYLFSGVSSINNLLVIFSDTYLYSYKFIYEYRFTYVHM